MYSRSLKERCTCLVCGEKHLYGCRYWWSDELNVVVCGQELTFRRAGKVGDFQESVGGLWFTDKAVGVSSL